MLSRRRLDKLVAKAKEIHATARFINPYCLRISKNGKFIDIWATKNMDHHASWQGWNEARSEGPQILDKLLIELAKPKRKRTKLSPIVLTKPREYRTNIVKSII